MKSILFGLIVFIAGACGNKKIAEEKILHERFSAFIEAIDQNDTSTALSYIYSRVFKYVQREEIEISIEDTDDDPEEKIEMDSVRIDTIYPIFHADNGSYAIATYSLRLRAGQDTLPTKTDTSAINHLIGDAYAAPQAALMATLMKERYGIEITEFKQINGKTIMKAKFPVIAVKDEYSKDWSFLTITSEQDLLNKLFTKKVLEKLAAYNKN